MVEPWKEHLAEILEGYTQPKTYEILMKQGAFGEPCLKKDKRKEKFVMEGSIRVTVPLFVNAAGDKGDQKILNVLNTSIKHTYQ